jgi:predicted nucleic acid-binding Zn ribbon protein
LLEILLSITNSNKRGPKMDELAIIELFCIVDEFSLRFQKICSEKCIEYTKQKIRKRTFRTSLSEVLTILLLFHRSNYRTFKHFYINYVNSTLKHFFPNLVGYSRFVQLTSEAFFPMFCFIQEHQGTCEGILFIDSTILTVCHVKRAASHRTFKEQARWGKTTTGWFFGFKLHLVINHHAEIVAFKLTSGNIDDRKPIPKMVKNMKEKAFADRGYISERLVSSLMKTGIHLFTKVKKNMKNKLMLLIDKLILKKRAIIESVINILKSSCQIEHHRHRSRWNFLSNLMAGLATYCLNSNKPRLFFFSQRDPRIKTFRICMSKAYVKLALI